MDVSSLMNKLNRKIDAKAPYRRAGEHRLIQMARHNETLDMLLDLMNRVNDDGSIMPPLTTDDTILIETILTEELQKKGWI